MDAKPNIESRLLGRYVTEGPKRESHRTNLDAMGLTTLLVAASDDPANVAPHLPVPAIAHECGSKSALLDVAEIFKKTPCAAGLKPGGRDLAKDMPEVDGIPLLMKTLLDHGTPHGDSITAADRMVAENLKTVKRNPYEDIVFVAGKPITVSGAGDRILNVELTDKELAASKSKWKPCATNHSSGTLWIYARQVGPAVDGAATHPGGTHEKQCYADI
jgi:dihydroxyacid dehydratase/phosphogluconate dehydratase